MHINTSTDYAIRMILYLAKSQQTVSSAKLAKALDLSPRYLLQIGAKLRDAAILHTTHGSVGGFVLSKSPEDISLYDIVVLMEDTISTKKSPKTSLSDFQIVNVAYSYLGKAVDNILRSITIESLLLQNTNEWYLTSYMRSL